jgi:phospholipase C
VTLTGSGSGTVTSRPGGINCGTTCTANFPSGTQVSLTAAPSANSYLVSWTACSGMGVCTVMLNSAETVTGTVNVWPVNHIIFLAQENRSFDHYFGELREYWAENGYPDQPFDGLPQFNPSPGPAPTNPGCDPNFPPPHTCGIDSKSPTITSYHLITQCIENTSPFWNEAHNDWDYNDPTGVNPAQLNGFVWTAAYNARARHYFDSDGIRAMGYYTGDDLNYYYFMASNFGTSDRWFNPVMTRTQPNREYLIAATSQGDVYPIGSNPQDKKLLTATTIFQELEDAGITWKIYVNPTHTGCSGPPYSASCLLQISYVQNFKWGQTIPAANPQNIGTIGPPGTCGSSPCDFESDLANGTLPQVAQIEPASNAGLDEHPSDFDDFPQNIQLGANYVSGLINSVMQSSEWDDSVFILTFDEFGGLYDHVSPQSAVSPDGIAPVDLQTGDICTSSTGPTCDFVNTGYRVPLIVISPYAKKNYVSHTVADTTAILKFIETRFGLSALTNRDANQPDMSEFFDFNNPPWMTPPNPPQQNTNGACYLTRLP